MAPHPTPQELRQQLEAVNYDWAQILTPAEMDQPLPSDQWDGHRTLRSWLADGAYTRDGAYYATRKVCFLITR